MPSKPAQHTILFTTRHKPSYLIKEIIKCLLSILATILGRILLNILLPSLWWVSILSGICILLEIVGIVLYIVQFGARFHVTDAGLEGNMGFYHIEYDRLVHLELSQNNRVIIYFLPKNQKAKRSKHHIDGLKEPLQYCEACNLQIRLYRQANEATSSTSKVANNTAEEDPVAASVQKWKEYQRAKEAEASQQQKH